MGFQQGLSGLNASAKNLEVIGNNVANANTVGAKGSRAEFGDMYASAINGTNIGIGVNLQAVTQQFSQGNITTTGNALDLAINGGGFFELSNGTQTVYSRNGQFQKDKDGYIVNNAGLKLMGYPADTNGTIQPGIAQPLKLPTGGVPPQVTSKISAELNLDSRLGVTKPATAPDIDFSDANSYNNATSLSVFDAKGQDVALTYYFQKSATDTWNVYATANGTTIGGTAAAPAPIATITFSADGSTPTITGASGSTVTGTSLSFDIPASTNAAGAQALAITGVSMNLSGVTQFGSPYGVTNLAQDGFAAGQLSGVTIEKSGIVMATYSNGQSKPAGQLELATFRNEQGLTPLGGNLWARSASSGDPIVGTPSTGNLGDLQPGALEESNVDLTSELVNMITAQRVYQANAQTIKTEDQIMQTLVNLR